MFQQSKDSIVWRLHLRSSPLRVYEMLSTDQGRAPLRIKFTPDGIVWSNAPNISKR
jgi:hypothetical protein